MAASQDNQPPEHLLIRLLPSLLKAVVAKSSSVALLLGVLLAGLLMIVLALYDCPARNMLYSALGAFFAGCSGCGLFLSLTNLGHKLTILQQQIHNDLEKMMLKHYEQLNELGLIDNDELKECKHRILFRQQITM